MTSDALVAEKNLLAKVAALEAENAAIRRERDEVLAQQAATSDILKVISRSPSDVQPVLDVIVETARILCGAIHTSIFMRRGDVMEFKAAGHADPAFVAFLKANPPALNEGTLVGRTALLAETVFVEDALTDPTYKWKEAARRGGYRSTLGVPLLRNGEAIGVLAVTHSKVRAFSPKQIAVLQTFADQAVIAIENARLFQEVETRTRDLQESLEQQTATADVLKVISRSAFDLQPVLGTLIDTAVRLCRGSRGTIYLREGDMLQAAAFHSNVPPELKDHLAATPLHIDDDRTLTRAAREGRIIHIEDFTRDPATSRSRAPNHARFGSMLYVPLMRGGEAIGLFAMPREEVDPFGPREIALVQTFADQAVIAIENARLFDEVQDKTRSLTEALGQQTAIAGALTLINRAVTDLPLVLDALTRSAAQICGADCVALWMVSPADGCLTIGSHYGYKAAFEPVLREARLQMTPDSPYAAARAAAMSDVVVTGDVRSDARFNLAPEHAQGGYVSVLAVPLVREGRVLGVFGLDSLAVDAFGPRQIEAARTFADQAVIAIENARLFDEAQARTRELQASLEELKATQDRLVQTEKLASLGQLTAGIAHEIKNPLNFVNNFSALSAEMMDELTDILQAAGLPEATRAEVEGLIALLKGNLDKVVSHGKRADSIVRNMLLHSRTGSGERRTADVNALVEEALNLAYHGARAETPGFDVVIERGLDPQAGSADLFPQEIARVLVNLVGNAFYAVAERRKQAEPGYAPTVSAATRDLGHSVEILIRDNGTGIPPAVAEQMFNPFFTTKPAGEGTGLGLSLSHDIVVKQHGGTIAFATEQGSYTAFTITLPRKAAGATGGKAP